MSKTYLLLLNIAQDLNQVSFTFLLGLNRLTAPNKLLLLLEDSHFSMKTNKLSRLFKRPNCRFFNFLTSIKFLWVIATSYKNTL